MNFLLGIMAILIFVQVCIICLLFSNIVVEVQECNILYNSDIEKRFDVKKLRINIKLYIFKKLRIFYIKIYENYCEIFKIKIELNTLKKLKDDNESGLIFVLKNIKRLEPEIRKLNFNLDVGAEEPIITTFSIPVLSTILSIFLTKCVSEYNKNNYKFKIRPMFIGTNCLLLNGNAILNFNTIKVLYFIKKYREIKV